jgi:hypothetical protein
VARPVYSVNLAHGALPTGGGGTIFTPEDGYTYVVRDIYVTVPQVAGEVPPFRYSGFQIAANTSGVNLLSVVVPFCLYGVTYHREARYVMLPGELLTGIAGGDFFNFSISGYQLTTP